MDPFAKLNKIKKSKEQVILNSGVVSTRKAGRPRVLTRKTQTYKIEIEMINRLDLLTLDNPGAFSKSTIVNIALKKYFQNIDKGGSIIIE